MSEANERFQLIFQLEFDAACVEARDMLLKSTETKIKEVLKITDEKTKKLDNLLKIVTNKYNSLKAVWLRKGTGEARVAELERELTALRFVFVFQYDCKFP